GRYPRAAGRDCGLVIGAPGKSAFELSALAEGKARSFQQAGYQCKIARPRLGPSLSQLSRRVWSFGPSRPRKLRRVTSAWLQKVGMLAAKKLPMRDIKLSGREAAVVRAIGFAESMLGAEILDSTSMEPEDVGDTLNGLIAAGFVETIPYAEQVDLAEMPSTAFEVNP